MPFGSTGDKRQMELSVGTRLTHLVMAILQNTSLNLHTRDQNLWDIYRYIKDAELTMMQYHSKDIIYGSYGSMEVQGARKIVNTHRPPRGQGGSEMSADNGVYVLKSPSSLPNGNDEYRVAHAQAIENLQTTDEKFSRDWEHETFNPSPVYFNKDEAILAAHKIAETIEVLEYGVRIIHMDHAFPQGR